jgi:hypothetical protein
MAEDFKANLAGRTGHLTHVHSIAQPATKRYLREGEQRYPETNPGFVRAQEFDTVGAASSGDRKGQKLDVQLEYQGCTC